jgi:hypothetical protein
VTAACPVSNEPRAASNAASRARAWAWERQPGRLRSLQIFDTGQVLDQLRDPLAQLLRFLTGRRLPALQFSDQRPH